MKCKLCDKDAKLIKAHIVPEAFFRSVMAKPGEGIRILSNNKRIRPRRAPIGVYDKQLVCASCETGFGIYDDYGQQVLLTNSFSRKPILDGKNPLGYLLEGIDYKRFKLFALSVLWRAAISTNDYYKSINLGPHTPKLKDLVLRGAPGDPNDFAVYLDEYIFPSRPFMWKPYSTRIEGIRFCAISMGKYSILVKVDKRPLTAWNLHLQPGKPLGVVYRNFIGSPLEPMFWNAIKIHGWPGERTLKYAR